MDFVFKVALGLGMESLDIPRICEVLSLIWTGKNCFLFVCLFVCLFRDRVSLCSSGCPGTHSVDQASLELRNPPVSASLPSAGIKGVRHHHPALKLLSL